MKNIRCCLRLFFLLSVCAAGYARQPALTSEYAYRHYTTQDGLPSYAIESLYQDSRGFIWVATANGFARYDGFRFESYLKGRFSNITRVSENSRQEPAAYGFSLYTIDQQADTIQTKHYPEGFYAYRNNHPRLPREYAILNNTAGRRILYRDTDTSWVKVLEHPDLDRTLEFAIRPYIDTVAQRIYLPLETGLSVVSLNGKKIAAFEGYFARDFFHYDHALCFIATNGIFRIVNNEKIELIQPLALNEGTITLVCSPDKNGHLIFCDDRTIYRYDGNTVETIFEGINHVTDLLIDTEGNLWVATYEGVYNLFRLQFRNYSFPDKKDVVRGVVPDGPNGVIAGTYRGALLRVQDGKSTVLSYPANPHGQFFGAENARSTEAAYFAGAQDVLKICGKNIRWLNLPQQNYRFVATQQDGTLICSGEKTIRVITPEGRIVRSFSTDSLPQTCHSCVCADSRGTLWYGGGKGITSISGKTAQLIRNDYAATTIVTVHDNAGMVWFGSENRLLQAVNDTTVRLVHTFEALIRSIFFTSKDRIIVTTLDGIYIAATPTADFVKYDHLNGFTGTEPMAAKMAEDAEGTVWMPAVTCLVTFRPEALLIEQPKPKLYVQSLQVSKDNVFWRKKDLRQPELSHHERNLRIGYIGLLYSASSNVRYRYRLTGFQNKWSQPVAKREVTFNNLLPGRYTFELKADAGVSGTETETISLPLYIRPAFWQTWLFKIAIFVACAGLIAFFVFRYLKRRHEREIRRVNRQKEMNELRIQSIRLKSIPHFNSNVLAGIEYFILTKSKEEANELLSTYSRFTNITLHDIDKAQRSLKDELDYVQMYLRLEKMRYGDKLMYTMDIAADARQEVQIPNMVLHTFTENAVKHGIRDKNSPGRVVIRAVAERNGVRLSVEDDGVGRSVSAEKNLALGRQGHGLSILTRQIALYNQQNAEKIEEKIVDLKDENGEAIGTRFELYVPYEYKYV